MQIIMLLFLIPFLGLASASHLMDPRANATHYSCDECKSFFNRLQLSDSEKLKSEFLNVCVTVLPMVVPNRKEFCTNSAEDVFVKMVNADSDVLCYAINSCPAPRKLVEESPKLKEADDCYFCAGMVMVASNSLFRGFDQQKDFISTLHTAGWIRLAEKLSALRIDDELQPIAMNKFLGAFARNEMDHKHALAYCNSIKICKQFPYHV